MSENKIYPAASEFVAQVNITATQYEELYLPPVDDPEDFWSEQAAYPASLGSAFDLQETPQG